MYVMPKKSSPQNIKDGKTTQELVQEYLKREAVIDEQIADLRESKKDLKEEFKDRIDLKVLAKAQRVVKARQSVADQEEQAFQDMLDWMEADLQFRISVRQTG